MEEYLTEIIASASAFVALLVGYLLGLFAFLGTVGAAVIAFFSMVGLAIVAFLGTAVAAILAFFTLIWGYLLAFFAWATPAPIMAIFTKIYAFLLPIMQNIAPFFTVGKGSAKLLRWWQKFKNKIKKSQPND